MKLAVIFAVFLGPLIAAFAWYYGLGASLAPRAATNHAPLLTPPHVVQPFANRDRHGELFTAESLKHRWHLIHFLPANCDSACDQSLEKFLYHSRQVRIALGKDAPRLRRVFIANRDAIAPRLAAHLADHPDAVVLFESANSDRGIEIQLRPLIAKAIAPAIDQSIAQHGIGNHAALLIDPIGNVMMVIPDDLNPKLLLKDLKHLLRVSRIG